MADETTYQESLRLLSELELLDIDPLEARSLVETILGQTDSDNAVMVYSSLYGACWNILTTARPDDPAIPAWQSVFLKATVLFRSMGKAELAQKAFVLSDMMAISIKRGAAMSSI